MVDIIEARTNALAWRGTVSGDVDPAAKPEQRDKNINRAAQKMFRNFPPKP